MADWEEDGDPWTILRVRRSYETDWFAVDDHDVLNPAGRPGHYGVIRIRRPAVGVLPVEADGSVHLVGQWRFPLKRYSWEMPEGGAEPGEDLELCARRELEEETGLKAAQLQKILEMDLSNSLTDEHATLFLATELTPGEAQPEEVEVLKRQNAHFQEVLRRVLDGRIRDGLTVAAVLRAHHMAVTGELPATLARAMLA
ncbi:MAG TPA: NUDIX hydrolase [Caulobacterales bacterium]|nr:NUDIX hydrolase [Caulobacterales bacterium]